MINPDTIAILITFPITFLLNAAGKAGASNSRSHGPSLRSIKHAQCYKRHAELIQMVLAGLQLTMVH